MLGPVGSAAVVKATEVAGETFPARSLAVTVAVYAVAGVSPLIVAEVPVTVSFWVPTATV